MASRERAKTTLMPRVVGSVVVTAWLLPLPSASFVHDLPRLRAVSARHTRLEQYYDSTRSTLQTPASGILYAYRNDSSYGSYAWPPGTSPHPQPLGSVTLIGAGPGDPDLLTVAAFKALTEKPQALYIADRLIAQETLNIIQGELRIARKRPGCAEQAQQEIYDWAREAVNAGRDVVRLKIGDPFLFGRGGEEVLEFRKYGVEPKVIPGVSSAFSAPLLANIPVTHRNVANQVYICTGYGKDGDRPHLAPYYRNQTAVFLMAVGRLQELCENLEQVGYPSTTPVAIVERASTPQQRTLLGNIRSIVRVAEEQQAAAPAIIVVGEVVRVLLEEEEEVGLEHVLGIPLEQVELCGQMEGGKGLMSSSRGRWRQRMGRVLRLRRSESVRIGAWLSRSFAMSDFRRPWRLAGVLQRVAATVGTMADHS